MLFDSLQPVHYTEIKTEAVFEIAVRTEHRRTQPERRVKVPNISVEGPSIRDIDKKRVLVKEITEAAVKAYGLPAEVIVVTLKENEPENVAVGGQLICDRRK